ncbi:hypothetical protein UlMin_030656 [Ulmus minor]
MLKRLPSRTHRSKGIRVKHVLQICLLLGVCFWLVYQVKHSHDKKKEFAESDAKTSIRKISDGELPKLGRKDLHPREVVTKSEKPEEEEEVEEETSVEEEEKHEEEEREGEDTKHEVQEQEEEENKNEETEDGGRGGGDDEIDENDLERKDEEINRDDDFVDEEKEREEGDEENKTSETEEIEDQGNENSSEDQDLDGGDQNAHEAREEHYKGDDASSEVTQDARDTQAMSTGSETVSLGNSNETLETNHVGQENKSNNTDESKSGLKVEEVGISENSAKLDMVALVQKTDNSSSNPVDSQLSDRTQSYDQPEVGNNSSQVNREEASNSSAVVSTEASGDSTEMRKNEMPDSTSQQNNATTDGTTIGESSKEETTLREQTNSSTIASEANSSEFNSTLSMKVENTDVGERTQTDDGSRSSITIQNEKPIDASAHGEEEEMENDPIDASDIQIAQEVKDVSTDLDTLPEITTRGNENEEIAAE